MYPVRRQLGAELPSAKAAKGREGSGEPDFRGWKGRSDGQTLGQSSGAVRKDRERGRLCGRRLGAGAVGQLGLEGEGSRSGAGCSRGLVTGGHRGRVRGAAIVVVKVTEGQAGEE